MRKTRDLLRYQILTSDIIKGENINPKNILSVDRQEYTQSPNYNEYKFKVQSEHNTTLTYTVGILVNIKDEEIADVMCTCPQFWQKRSCKHVAACVHNYAEVLFKKDDNYAEKITSELMKLLSSDNDLTLGNKKQIQMRIDFNPNFYYHNVDFDMKVGLTKLYSVRSKTEGFIRAYRKSQKNYKFGKDYTMDMSTQYFNSAEEKIIKALWDNYGRSYFYDLDSDKVEVILNQINNVDIYVNSKKINEIEKGLPFESTLSENDDYYVVTMKNDSNILPLTRDYKYLINTENIYKLNQKEIDFYRYIMSYGLDKLKFKKSELNTFSRSILTVLKHNITVDENIKDLTITSKPIPKIYFDIKEDITAKVMFDYDGTEINYFEVSSNILRDEEVELSVINELLKYNFKLGKKEIYIDELDSMGEFLESGIDELADKYQTFTSQKLKDTHILKNPGVSSTFTIGKDNIMKYDFNLGEISSKEIDKVLSNLKEKQKYYRLKSGAILNLNYTDDLKVLDDISKELGINLKSESGTIPKYRAIYLDSLKNKNGRIIKTDNLFNQFISKFNEYKNEDLTISKKDLKVLRDYQETGVKWLKNIHKTGLGGILADEMGLGKSAQTLFFIKEMMLAKKDFKTLIVVPTSLSYNWKNEIEKFTPNIPYKILVGIPSERKKMFESLKDENIIVTTYGLLREDISTYEQMQFDVMFIDEAQNIKNHNTLTTKAVKSVQAETKFALTGTPLENSVLELWSIFDYIMPGFLGGPETFNKKYKVKEFDDDANEKLTRLNKQISPFILRRKKKDVIKELPDKIENNIFVDLNDAQKVLYSEELKYVNEEFDKALKDGGESNVKFLILKLLTKLRQMCITPELVFENYTGGSSKLDMLIDVVKTSISNGHKILLFSSFKTAIDLVRKEFDKEHITSYTIDGSVPGKKRNELVESFNKDLTNVFLITLKAGGTGLNLTSADIVIHLDLWWNPQAENQATDRAHRIGQKNVVEVIKIINKGTIEEKILDLQVKKRTLSDKLIESEDRDQNLINKLTIKDMKQLLSYENKD